MFKLLTFTTLLVAAYGQQITRTVTTQQQPQLIQGARTITLEELQRLGINIQGLTGGSNIQTLNTNAGLQGQTISLSSLQGLQGQGQGNVRLIQIPVGGLQTQGVNVATLSGGSQGITTLSGGGRTTITTSSRVDEDSRSAINFPPPPPPSITVTRNSFSSNSVNDEEVGEPKPEPYNFAYTSETDDGSVSTREERQDANGVVTGFYTIKTADGQDRRVDYIADENGYRATITTNEVGTESQSPADVDLQSSAETGSQASLRYTAELEANGGRQDNSQNNQGFASVRTTSTRINQAPQRASAISTNQRSSSNFEIIRPAAINAAVTSQQSPNTRFVLVPVPQGQEAPRGAVSVPQFLANRQASASEERPFVAFGTRMSNRFGTKSRA